MTANLGRAFHQRVSTASLPTFNFAFAASNPPGQARRLSRAESFREFHFG